MRLEAPRSVFAVSEQRKGRPLPLFLNLATKKYAKQVMKSIRDPNTGEVCHDPFAIIGVWQNYYQDLFTATQCDPVAQDELLAKLTRRLNQTERASCEGCLTVDKCFQALMGMSRSKMPDSDGYPMEFYVAFWEALCADLVRVLNLAFETGFSTSQRRETSSPPVSVEGLL